VNLALAVDVGASKIALAMVGEVPVIGLDSWDVDGVQVAGSPQEAVRRALALAAGGGAPDTAGGATDTAGGAPDRP